jgi:butyrate kinase
MPFRVLTILPKKITTQIGLFNDRCEIMRKEIRHDREELAKYENIMDQWVHRLRALEDSLYERPECDDEMEIDAVISSIGSPQNLPGGVYVVDDELLGKISRDDANAQVLDLGAPLASALSHSRRAKAFVVVSLSCDEFDPISRITGLPHLPFNMVSNALSIKDAAHRASEAMGCQFQEFSAIVAYLGINFSICALKNGRMLDLTDSNERGPFSPTRSGALPAAQLIRMAYSGMWSKDSLLEKATRHGGLESYTGTWNILEVSERKAEGDVYSALVLRSMAYQTAQEISAQATVLYGDVDAVILTGACAASSEFMEFVIERISWITDTIFIYPEEDELAAMASSAMRVLRGTEAVLTYSEVM